MLEAVRALPLLIVLSVSGSMAFGQASQVAPAFDVASVKPSQHKVGPDYNNQIRYSPTEFTARNVTLKRLLAEACHLQMNQVSGPGWLSQNEYDIEARAAGMSTREQMAPMLRNLIAERFNLKQHSEMREMRVYELVVGPSGAKIHPMNEGEPVKVGGEFHFHGDLREFADCLPSSSPYPLRITQPNQFAQVPHRLPWWTRQDSRAFLISVWTSGLNLGPICSRRGRGHCRIS
jgi:hypothetical protein